MKLLPVLLLLWSLVAGSALAAPAIQCHCFQDRSFDPDKPAAVDPYLLATTRNTLFAIVFGQDKKSVVRARMGGTSAEDLWTGQFLAARAGVPAERVAGLRSEGLDWPALAERLRIPPAVLGGNFSRRLAAGADTAGLAAAAVDTVLAEELGIAERDLQALRGAGAGDAEAILAAFLGRKTARPAADIFARVRGGESWGTLFAGTALLPAAIDHELRTMIGTRDKSPD